MSLPIAKRALNEARASISVRPEFLLADMALFGLLDEVSESVQLAELILETKLPHRAIPHVRVAYEAGQNALILATDPEYGIAGAQMLIYFLRRDRDLVARAEKSGAAEAGREPAATYEKNLSGYLSLWKELHSSAEVEFREARRRVDNLPKRPDNWLGKDPAAVLAERYGVIATKLGTTNPTMVAAVTAGTYSLLSRGSHLRPAFPEILVKDSAGNLAFKPPKRDRALALQSAVLGATAATGEAMLAATYRVARAI